VNVPAPATDLDDAEKVIDLWRAGPRPEALPEVGMPARRQVDAPRDITAEDWRRFERYAAEILTALGMDLDTPGTRETPRRFLRALYDSTAGDEGDPNLLTAFPSERRDVGDTAPSQIIEGPIAFHSLCEHHALPFY
jgi:GTP cyclohydrolase I